MTDPPPDTTRRDLLRRLSFRITDSPGAQQFSGQQPTSERETSLDARQSLPGPESPGKARAGTGPNSAERVPPVAGSTIRLSTNAMACEFSVIMNPGPTEQIEAAGLVLECVHEIESWLSIYRPDSELSLVNQRASEGSSSVSERLFALLRSAKETSLATSGGFDMATGSLIQLWRRCRKEERIPTPEEIRQARNASGFRQVELDDVSRTVRFRDRQLSLDPGAIGKGYALDECLQWMDRVNDAPRDFLIHGGHSSLVARGTHNGLPGWPVGIGNPLFTERRLGTILLQDEAMATSGSNIQFYRFQGRRYGHILDPRTGWPVDGMLSVTAIAHSAALADAISTAFFVLGIEKARLCCENLPGIGVILIPFPTEGKRVQPTVIGLPDSRIFWDSEQVTL